MDPSISEPPPTLHAILATIGNVLCSQAAEPAADCRGAEAEEHPSRSDLVSSSWLRNPIT